MPRGKRTACTGSSATRWKRHAPDGPHEPGDSSGTTGPDDAGPLPRDAADPVAGLFYDPAYRTCLGALVAGLLRLQGPLREDRLVQAVARLHGFGRAGREIRDRVMAMLPETSIVTTEDIGRLHLAAGD